MLYLKKVLLLLISSLMILATDLSAKDISAYLIGSHESVQTVTNKLKKAGFEVLAEYESVRNGVTVVFTNEDLKSIASKKKRAHAAILRVFVDNQEKRISITNPVYFGRAFMQNDYNTKVFKSQLEVLKSIFHNLKDSADKMDEDDLSGYHFMVGMPYYEDVDELGKGSTKELLEKAKSYKKGKHLLFSLKLSDNSYLLGYDLSSRTKKFVKKIGRANAAVLPYCISIEDGLASSMEAKYYLALSYPLLTMSEFTTIATVPGAIAKELAKPFK